MLIPLILACSPTTDPKGTPTASSRDTALDLAAPAWSADDAVAAWDAQDIQAALELNATLGFANPESIRRSFLDFMTQDDGTCPSGGENFGSLKCTTESGYTFSGISIYQERSSSVDGARQQSWTHVGDYKLTRPDGTSFESGGGLVSSATVGTGLAEIDLKLRGSWIDAGSNMGWFRSGLSWLLLGLGRRDAEVGELTLDGGVTTGRAVYFDDVRFSTDPDCRIEGTLSIQGDDGHWYDWQAGCDGCGPTSLQGGEELGSICPALDTWAAAAMLLVPGLEPEVMDTGLEDGP